MKKINNKPYTESNIESEIKSLIKCDLENFPNLTLKKEELQAVYVDCVIDLIKIIIKNLTKVDKRKRLERKKLK